MYGKTWAGFLSDEDTEEFMHLLTPWMFGLILCLGSGCGTGPAAPDGDKGSPEDGGGLGADDTAAGQPVDTGEEDRGSDTASTTDLTSDEDEDATKQFVWLCIEGMV